MLDGYPLVSIGHPVPTMLHLALAASRIVLLGSSQLPEAAPIDRFAGDTSGLSPFIGIWTGEGEGPTGPIRDSLTFAVALDGRALRFSMISRTADRFQAEGYLWSTGQSTDVELVEFSTVTPFRHFIGSREAEGLVLEELPATRHTRVRLELSASGALRLQELDTRMEPPDAFVTELFHHQAR
jgi:hypothetical protein